MKTIVMFVGLGVSLFHCLPAFADCGATCNAGSCMFDGIHNDPLGSASLSLDGQCRLAVGNIGGTGLDGVVQTGLGSTYMVTTLATPNFSGSILGTGAEIFQIGVAAGQSGRELSLTRIVNVNGDLLRLSMTCEEIGVATYSVEVYDHDGLVFAQAPVIDPPVLLFPKGDMEAMACAILPSGELYTTVRLGGLTPITIQTATGEIGPYTGSCLKLRGFEPAEVPTTQEAIENYFKNTGDVSIRTLFAGALPPEDHVCPLGTVPALPFSWGELKVLYR